MAVDQREALIAAVRAQVEKERAEKAAKLQREQEAMAFAGKGKSKKPEETQKKYKTLTPEELAKIEERKRRKRAEELGIDLDAPKEDEVDDDPKTEVLTSPGPKAGLKGAKGPGLGSVPKGGLNSVPEPTGGLAGGLGGGLGSVPEGGLGLNLGGDKVIDNKAKGKVGFNGENTTVVGSDGWESKDEDADKISLDDIESILPTNRQTPSNDVNSMYDIDDDDDSSFKAQADKIAAETKKDGKDDDEFLKADKKEAKAEADDGKTHKKHASC